MKCWQNKYGCGVTLIEMLVVMALIAMLATIVVVVVARIENQSEQKGLEQLFALLDGALEEYRDFKGQFPSQPERDFTYADVHSEYLYRELESVPECRKILQKINAIFIQDNFDSGLEPVMPEIYDPWSTKNNSKKRVIDYIYDPNRDSYPHLISAGPDREFNTPDDITNM